MSLVGSTMVGKYRLYYEPLLSASECLSFRLSFVATIYSYLDRGKPGANKPPYPLTLVCHSYPSRLFFSSLYTSLKRVRFFSILQTHYGCLCQQCNQSEHLSLARQKTCPPRGLCETLNFTTLENVPLLQSHIGTITELLRWLFCFSFHSVGSVGPVAT